MPVEIRNGHRGWRVDTQALRRQAGELLAALESLHGTLSLLLTDDREMAEIHERWMGRKGPTDVLAFPQTSSSPRHPGTPAPPCSLLGDIVISVETARRRNPRDPEKEIRRYLVHGLLHLFGHDHVRAEDRRKMQREARRLLNRVQGGGR